MLPEWEAVARDDLLLALLPTESVVHQDVEMTFPSSDPSDEALDVGVLGMIAPDGNSSSAPCGHPLGSVLNRPG
jgi:hypothetical protein